MYVIYVMYVCNLGLSVDAAKIIGGHRTTITRGANYKIWTRIPVSTEMKYLRLKKLYEIRRNTMPRFAGLQFSIGL